MIKKEKIILVLTSSLIFFALFSSLNNDSNPILVNPESDINDNPNISVNLEGIENIVITEVNRVMNISGYGLVIYEDILLVKNLNNNPISSVLFGIPIGISDDLVFFEATGVDQNTLLIERSSLVMNGHEMIVIYLDSPLLPHQTRLIRFLHIYQNLINYFMLDEQDLIVTGIVYPLLPYRMEGSITTVVNVPESGTRIDDGGAWGVLNPTLFTITYNFDSIKDEIGDDFIDPFLENLGDKAEILIFYSDIVESRLELSEIKREIFISPWGIIRVREDFSLENLGLIDFYLISFKIPQLAKNVYISDQLGEIYGVTITDSGNPNYKNVDIQLFANRIRIKPNSTFSFSIEYYLPFEHFVSINWFQESFKIDLLTTIFKYLGRDQTINIIIDGCYRIDSLTEAPESIIKSKGTTTLTYKTDVVTPNEKKIIQITFTVDLFNLLLRPIIFILSFVIIAFVFVFLTKIRKKELESTSLTRKYIPVDEIREFSSLSEEKNALTLEIRKAEEATKRKKMAKKKYKNILEKNSSKIDEIQKEIIPFKKILTEAGEIFENIIKRLDILETERFSVKDSLKLLETRYKRGRLPSRAAYQKLSEDFNKRRRKIDRTIDKLLQQLRSYLL